MNSYERSGLLAVENSGSEGVIMEQNKAKCTKCDKLVEDPDYTMCDECNWWYVVGLFN
jgi:hypothetical protein